MKSLFRLIRFPNLIVIAITQWLVAVTVIGQSASTHGMNLALNTDQLILLILATVSISAAAYCINDILDYPIDMVNRAEKVIVNKEISASTVYWLIAVFTIFGFICALILAFQKNELEWLWLYPFFTLLLGGYSRIFKMYPFIGNLLIATSCSAVAALVWLAERSTWQAFPGNVKAEISRLLVVFMVYAFLATWIREIVKDLEDYQGDIIGGRKTLPIAFGESTTKIFIHFLAIILVAVLFSSTFLTTSLIINANIYVLTSLLILILFLMQYLLIRAKKKEEYHRLSSIWKYFMLGGLLLLFLY